MTRRKSPEERLLAIHSALSEALGDTDPNPIDDETDEELRERDPLFWAAKELALLMREAEFIRNYPGDPEALQDALAHPNAPDGPSPSPADELIKSIRTLWMQTWQAARPPQDACDEAWRAVVKKYIQVSPAIGDVEKRALWLEAIADEVPRNPRVVSSACREAAAMLRALAAEKDRQERGVGEQYPRTDISRRNQTLRWIQVAGNTWAAMVPGGLLFRYGTADGKALALVPCEDWQAAAWLNAHMSKEDTRG